MVAFSVLWVLWLRLVSLGLAGFFAFLGVLGKGQGARQWFWAGSQRRRSISSSLSWLHWDSGGWSCYIALHLLTDHLNAGGDTEHWGVVSCLGAGHGG